MTAHPAPGPVDSSAWQQPVAHTKNGDNSHPDPVPLSGGVRAFAPDPYTEDNPHVLRNFSRDPSPKEER